MPLATRELDALHEIVSLPTAPFCESRVQQYVRRWAAARGIELHEDPVGNILVKLAGGGDSSGAPWVFQAHMDHPGFSFVRRRGRSAQAWFRGGVRKEYFSGARMRFFPEEGRGVGGTVLSVRKDAGSGFLRCGIELDESVDIPEGTPGMWDLPAWRRRGDTLSLRAADDLCGVAAILVAFERLQASGCERPVVGLLTRAEEVGFIGALSAADHGFINPSWPILGIEASKAHPGAGLGEGAVVRVGDALSVFDPSLTAVLRNAARDLGAGRKTARLDYVAYLMAGGSTESTAFAQMGYRTCAVCLPLGNYHNMGPDRIAPEKINLRDFAALVALLVEVAGRNPDSAIGDALKNRLLDTYRKRSPLL